ncbi:TetR/AcrR family transcriptional regulator [Nocardia jejuensis]|uniref:TetR/AcrR family transcriptional regulator n=1 Tax=Nocardia jejuensis TaxID=328049 RepID=UPI000AC28716|nr:TetR/AcrR family transcriptional regulator [Nocardia jejuensis]
MGNDDIPPATGPAAPGSIDSATSGSADSATGGGGVPAAGAITFSGGDDLAPSAGSPTGPRSFGIDDTLGTAMASLERDRRRLPEGQRRIFLAAIDAFAERGFHATTTRDIAARAGLSPAGLYVHFGSKEEVLHRISLAALRLTQQVATTAAAGPGSVTQRLSSAIRDLTAWHAQHGASVRVVLHHLTDLTPDHRAEVAELQHSIHRVVRDLVTEGSDGGEFTVPDPGSTAIALLSLCVDTARWYHPDYRRSPDEIAAEYAATALRMVAAR